MRPLFKRSFEAGDLVMCIPGKENLTWQYDLEAGALYRVTFYPKGADCCQLGGDVYFSVNRLRKVTEEELTELECVIYGV